MKSIQCALCGRDQKIIVLYNSTLKIKKVNYQTFSARRIPDRTHYRLVKCLNCGLIFSNPIFNQKKINSLYFESDFNYDCESKYLRKTYFNYFKKYLLRNGSKNNKILEIGCGNGFFLEELRKNGLRKAYGVEPGKSSVDKAESDIRENIKISVLRRGLFPKETFDIICCFHTLDHVVDPNKFLEEVYRLLKKRGKIFFIVHNTNGLSVKLLKEKSPIFDIEHIYLFNSKNLKKIFSVNKFSDLKVVSIKNKYPLNYWLKLLPMPYLLKVNILKLLNLTKIGLLPISLNAGNIGIVGNK